MTVSVPLFADLLKKRMTPADMQAFYAEHYGDSRVVKVRPLGYSESMIGATIWPVGMTWKLRSTGNDERLLLTARFDNLGKGASGAAIQCMNIALGLDEVTGLTIGE